QVLDASCRYMGKTSLPACVNGCAPCGWRLTGPGGDPTLEIAGRDASRRHNRTIPQNRIYVTNPGQRRLGVAGRLKEARESRGLSHRQIAEVAKVSTRVVSALESERLDV